MTDRDALQEIRDALARAKATVDRLLPVEAEERERLAADDDGHEYDAWYHEQARKGRQREEDEA